MCTYLCGWNKYVIENIKILYLLSLAFDTCKEVGLEIGRRLRVYPRVVIRT